MENKTCPICEENLIEERWKAQSGKDCHAWRHEDKALAKTNCKDEKTDQPYIEWINEPKSKKIVPNRSNTGTLEYQSILKGLRELYVLVKAGILLNNTERDLSDMITKLKENK